MATWVFCVFILAGPMMIGGLYEAYTDWKVLSILQTVQTDDVPADIETRRDSAQHQDGRTTSPQGAQRGRDVPYDDLMAQGRTGPYLPVPQIDRDSSHSRDRSIARLIPNRPGSLTTTQKIGLLLSILAGNLSLEVGSPQYYLTAAFDLGNTPRETWLRILQTKLRSMMQAQSTFGTLVGAPVLFYIGSFVYSLVFLSQNDGDNDTAHSLAFGMW